MKAFRTLVTDKGKKEGKQIEEAVAPDIFRTLGHFAESPWPPLQADWDK